MVRVQLFCRALKHPVFLQFDLQSDGSLADILYLKNFETDAVIQMQGREVFKHAVERLTSSCRHLLSAAELTVDDVDWVVPHQANVRIIRSVISKLKMPEEKVVVTLDKHANTSAASIPLAFHTAVKDGRIQRGQRVLLEAFGGGLSWGGVILDF